MKAKTFYINGTNVFEIYFSYEDYYGGETFGSYDEMQKYGDLPNSEYEKGSIVGWLHSYYWGVHERLDCWGLKKKPTISDVRKFIKHCYEVAICDCIENGEPNPRYVKLTREQAEALKYNF